MSVKSLRERIARVFYPLVFERLSVADRKYHQVWLDHLARCNCHDSWDQCPCVEDDGHAERRGLTQTPSGQWSCVNACCRWCS